MSEDAGFWTAAQQGAANLNLEIVVDPDGRLSLRHKKHFGDPLRPTDKDVDTFKAFLSRNRERILKAKGIDPSKAPGIAQDARNLLAWLNSHDDSPECLLKTADGHTIRFHAERRRLVKSFAEDGRWILQAHKFQKAVRSAVMWADPAATVPEAWT